MAAVLNQNPNCFVTAQSAFVELLWRNYSIWDDPKWSEDFTFNDVRAKKVAYLKGITELYYRQFTDCDIVIDNRKQWQSVGNIKMYADIFGELPKIVCLVRNVEEIVASFSNLFKKNNREFCPESNLEGNVFSDTYDQLKFTYNSIYRDCLHIIDYDDLVVNTDSEIEKIYKFLNIPSYKCNYKTLMKNPLLKDIDEKYDLIGMHDIKVGVHKSKTNPEEVLSEDQLKQFKKLSFWQNV